MNHLLNALTVITDSTPSDNVTELIETIVTTMLKVNDDTTDRKTLLAVKMADYQPHNVDYHDHDEWTIDGSDYRIFTDDEADDACSDSIKESVWAFNADFLARQTGIDSKVLSFCPKNANLRMIRSYP